MSDTTYFTVEAGSEMAIKIQEFWDTRQKQLEARVDFAKELGATSWIATARGILGFQFEGGKHPKDWIKAEKDDRHFRPAKRSKEGKAIRRRMEKDYPVHGAHHFTYSVMDADGLIMEGLSIRYAYPQRLCDQDIVGIPSSAGNQIAIPDSLTEMKMSEYYALKEKHDTAESKS